MMQPDIKNKIQGRFTNWSQSHSASLSATQSRMLILRRAGLAQIAGSISGMMAGEKPQTTTSLFDKNWLEEFATGNIVNCLGPDYSIYQNRRCPRIPNGDLLLMSRILSIQGTQGVFDQPSHITAEVDIPATAWYFDSSAGGALPVSIMLEIALQPCGVLSAWLGTQLRFPTVDFFFRNLDGDVRFLQAMDVHDKTIRADAILTRTVFSGSTIIQHFNFKLACEGKVFFSGSSSFGYFPEESMASQIGMDGGNPSLPWSQDTANATRKFNSLAQDEFSSAGLPAGKLRLIDEARVYLDGGSSAKGYVLAFRHNAPTDWFYTNHFFQDPVMPGSLGIEAVVQAFKAGVYSIENTTNPVMIAPGSTFQWKYRGQVLQNHQQMTIEVHIHNRQADNGRSVFTGSASLWADDMRIYEITNLSLQQEKGNL